MMNRCILLMLAAGLAQAITFDSDIGTAIQPRGILPSKLDSREDRYQRRRQNPIPRRDSNPSIASSQKSSRTPSSHGRGRNQYPDLSNLSLGSSTSQQSSERSQSLSRGASQQQLSNANRSPSRQSADNHGQRQNGRGSPTMTTKSDAADARDHPVRIRTSLEGQAIMHVYRGGSSNAEQYFVTKGRTLHKDFSDPKKLRVAMTPFSGGTHSADASGRKVDGTVETGKDSKGYASSWSYAAGRKMKETMPDQRHARVKAASSSISAPAGITGNLNGSGVITMEASNSPSTSPPGSPGKQPPQLAHLFGDRSRRGGR